MDFIVDLPKTKNNNNAILVVVDRLTKLAHFIPTKTDITAKQTAELIFNNIVSHYGYPESIVSDQDPKFTSSFW
jgi:hypothetical protein